ncbi:hypothetical protein BDW69DRAFT_116620 [Aspergillus filifer]
MDPLTGSDAQAYGSSHITSYPDLPHLANSAELLSELGISSYDSCQLSTRLAKQRAPEFWTPPQRRRGMVVYNYCFDKLFSWVVRELRRCSVLVLS